MTAIEEPPSTQKWVGQALRRKEDPRMITGRGRYVDDMVVPGMLYMAVVRSPEAHAKITSIDTVGGEGAARHPRRLHRRGPRPRGAAADGVGPAGRRDQDARALAAGQGRGQLRRPGRGRRGRRGQVRGRRRGRAGVRRLRPAARGRRPREGARGRRRARPPGSRDQPDRTSGRSAAATWTQAWAESDVVIERRIVNHRTAGTPIEPRVCIADYRGDQLTLHLTSQNPHLIRLFMAGELEMCEDRIRVIAPDVGGGFGVKIIEYPEEILASWISRKVGRAVKWTETRSEHMSSTIHGRDQIDYVKVGAKRDGTIVGLECTAICDFGAYYTMLTPFIPSFTGFVICGCYKIPNLKFTARGVFTNKMATDATRGAGRPGGHAPDRDDGRAARPRAGDGLARGPPQELHPQGGLPGRGGDRDRLRLRRLPRLARQAAHARRPRRVPARAGGAAGEGHLPRDRVLDLDGDLRPGAVARRRPDGRRPAGGLLRVLDRARARDRLGDRLLRHRAARPGPGHGVRADRRRPARASRPTWSTSSTATPAPARSASAPTARARWPSAASRSPARRPSSSTRPSRSPRTTSRPRPRTSSSSTASSPSRARRTRASRSPRSRARRT